MRFHIDTKGTFSAPEMEASNGLPRAVEILKRENLVPGQVTEPIRGKPARYAFKAQSRLSATAALSKSMAGGFVDAARIINAIAPAMEARYDGSIPFGFWDMQHALVGKYGSDTSDFRGYDGEWCPYRTIEAAWRAGLEDEKKMRANDIILMIVDGCYFGFYGAAFPHSVFGLLELRYFGKSGGLQIEMIEDELADHRFQERAANAESVLHLNLGLAIRRAVIRVIKMREAA